MYVGVLISILEDYQTLQELTRLAGRHRAPSRGGKPGPGRGTSGSSWFVVLQSSQDPGLYNSAAYPTSPHGCDIWYLLLREQNSI